MSYTRYPGAIGPQDMYLLFLHFREQHERGLRHGVHLEVSSGDGARCRGGGGGLGAAVVEEDRAPPFFAAASSSSSSPADEDVAIASPLAASSMTASFAAVTGEGEEGESESGLFIDS